MGTQLPLKGAQPPPPPIFGPCLLWPNGWMAQDATWYGGNPRPRRRCLDGVAAPPKRGTALQFSVHVYCGQTAGWMKTPLGIEIYLGPGHIVLDGDPAPLRKGHSTDSSPPLFGPCLLWPRSPISATAELLFSTPISGATVGLRNAAFENVVKFRSFYPAARVT